MDNLINDAMNDAGNPQIVNNENVNDPPNIPLINENHREINRIAIKIPAFWPDKPERWFYQIDAQFRIAGIVRDVTKFDYLISQLEPMYLDNIWDIATGVDNNKYQLAKERLSSIFGESEEKRIKRLLASQNLGDLKPSQLLRKLKSMAGNDVSDRVIKTLWFDNLPTPIKNVVITSEEGVDRLAIMADKIYEFNPTNEVYDIQKSNSASTSDSTNEISELRTDILALRKAIKEMNIGYGRSQKRSSTPTRNRKRSKSRNRFGREGKYCYFHCRYGKKCYPEKCTPPCSWEDSENANQ